MQEVRKLPGHSLKPMGIAGLSHHCLFHITDTISNYHFLIGTGTEVSILPATSAEHRQQQADFNLVAVNGGSIPSFGKHSLTLNMGSRRTFRYLFQVFAIANVHIPIIRANFLYHYSQLMDMTNSQLVDSVTQLRVQGILRQVESPRPSFFHHNMLHLQPLLSNIQLFSNHTSAAILVNITLCTTFKLMVLLSMHDHEDWLLKNKKQHDKS